MRFAMYAGASAALAGGVLLRAMHQRANFYSATVYLSQSNACLMILTNLALLGVATIFYGLQRLCYGALRPIEVEQLYEKAWFAITETCLAMTIFREEVGAWFLVMFVALLIGKVWGWIGEGRVDILEQQPPANPQLFHFRLSVSLALSILFNSYMLQFCVETVLRQARPNMMVMFAFEFAVLSVTSMSTLSRYGISLWEANVTRNQIRARRQQMRRARRQERQERQEAGGPLANLETVEDEINDIDFDVPGWEEKGRYVFYLDLMTDFFKLVLYLTFFCVLCMFYGMPIHIIRDVALTARSFFKRINDFLKYRQATKDMNDRYPDATPEEITREDVCIICREDMKAWTQVPGQGPGQAEGAEARDASQPLDERLRPKKLPCGHILHFACLRSWLERQQNCPTCRRPVLVSNSASSGPNGGNAQARRQPNFILNDGGEHPIVGQNVINFGPFRLAFGARINLGNAQNQVPQNPPVNNQQDRNPLLPRNLQQLLPQPSSAPSNPLAIPQQLDQLEQQILHDILSLQTSADQLLLVRTLQLELQRLRAARNQPNVTSQSVNGSSAASVSMLANTQGTLPPSLSTFQSQQHPMGPGHENLPPGMTVPQGWTVLPLQRADLGQISQFPVGNPYVPPTPQASSSQPQVVVNIPTSGTSQLNGTTPENEPPHNEPTSTITVPSDHHSHFPPANEHDNRPNPPLPFAAGPSSTADTQGPSLTNAHSPAVPSIPDWGSDNTITKEQAIPSVGGSTRDSQTNGHPLGDQDSGVGQKQDKGKGRAPTVEDVDDVE